MVCFQFLMRALMRCIWVCIGLQVRDGRSIWELEMIFSNGLYKKIYRYIVLLSTIRFHVLNRYFAEELLCLRYWNALSIIDSPLDLSLPLCMLISWS